MLKALGNINSNGDVGTEDSSSPSLIMPTDWESLCEGPSAHFAPVAPIHMLRYFERNGYLGHYHLLLAHDVADPVNEHAFWQMFHSRHPDMFIILDNSLIELGYPVTLDVILKACQIVRPNIVVLPDVLKGKDETIAMHRKAIEEWQKIGIDSFMAVIQGRTDEELYDFVQEFRNEPSIKMWSVPRVVGQTMGTRRMATQMVHTLSPHKPIHLLGFSDNVNDDLICARMPGVAGIDSAVPIRAGLCGRLAYFEDMPPRGDYWTRDPLGNELQRAIANMAYVRGALLRS